MTTQKIVYGEFSTYPNSRSYKIQVNKTVMEVILEIEFFIDVKPHYATRQA